MSDFTQRESYTASIEMEPFKPFTQPFRLDKATLESGERWRVVDKHYYVVSHWLSEQQAQWLCDTLNAPSPLPPTEKAELTDEEDRQMLHRCANVMFDHDRSDLAALLIGLRDRLTRSPS